MEFPARKADGRRIYTPQFKRQQISRVLRGELTELGRELGVARWYPHGGVCGVGTRGSCCSGWPRCEHDSRPAL